MKPSGCVGCPLSEAGKGFLADDDKHSNTTVWLAHPDPQGILGEGGWPLRATKGSLIPLATQKPVNIAHCVRCVPPPRPRDPQRARSHDKMIAAAAQHCEQHDTVTPRTLTHVAMGHLPLERLTNLSYRDALNDWRGYLHPYRERTPSHVWTPQRGEVVVYPTFEPGAIYSQPEHKPILQWDFMKLGRFLRGEWPQALPPISVGNDPRLNAAQPVAYDTEFHRVTRAFRMWSYAQPQADGMVLGISYKPVPTLMYPVGHNLPADWPYLPARPAMWDDTMYMHGILFAGYPHDLNFLGSMYARTNRWKHLNVENEQQYSALDALGTWDAWAALSAELALDPQVEALYQRTMRPLVPILAERPPMRLHKPRIVTALTKMKEEQERVVLEAQTYVGWPFNLAAPAQTEAALKQ